MYLTRMELDISKRKTIMALASPAMIHGTVERAFPAKGGKLWRIDVMQNMPCLLVVSDEMPDLKSAHEQFGTQNEWQTISYDSFLGKIQKGEKRFFRLKANPVITKSAGKGNRGKVLAHLTAAQQEQWLFERAQKYGFTIDKSEFKVVKTAWESFEKGTDGGKKVSFRSVVYEGVLTVDNPELFRATLCNGIGREKAYGCGMMTVSRALQ